MKIAYIITLCCVAVVTQLYSIVASSRESAMSRMSFQTKSIPYQPPKEKVVQGENMVVVTTEDETAYWRDNENVYYRKKIIPGADPNSFRYIVDTVFAIDKNTAYANEIPF